MTEIDHKFNLGDRVFAWDDEERVLGTIIDRNENSETGYRVDWDDDLDPDSTWYAFELGHEGEVQ